MTRVIGPPRSRRRRWTALGTLAAAVAVGLLLTVGAQAVNNTGAFELDGNAVTAHGTGAPDDWDRVCHQVTAGGKDSAGNSTDALCTSATNTNGATAVSWTDSTSSLEIYTGGGSKDFNDPQNDWLWKKADTVPDKDTILHAFAARYSLPGTNKDGTCPNGTDLKAGSTFDSSVNCEVIYFGSDRFDNSGDAQLGFWFFQNKVTTTSTASNGGFKFDGHHKTGDLLVISDFSNGGTTATIKVYSWQPDVCKKASSGSEDSVPVGGCPAANLRLEGKSDKANCATSAQNSSFCGIVNSATGLTTSPWPFKDKSANTNFAQGEFYEAGLNLTGLGFGTECFASVLGESRASDSTGAVLKDFVLSNFGECTSGTVTKPQQKNSDGTYSDISTDPSIGTSARVTVRDKATISVTGQSSYGGAVKFFLCGPLALDTTSNCSTGGVQIGSPSTGEDVGSVTKTNGVAVVNSDDAVLTSAGRYCWRAEYGGDTATGVPASTDPSNTTSTTECFKVQPVTPTLSTTASSDVTLGNAISDTARLSGTAKQPGTDGVGPGGTINASAATQAAAGGSISWVAYGPNDCATVAYGGSGSPQTRAVSGDGTYPKTAAPDNQAAVSFTPTAIGKYTFVASYDGSSPNTKAAGPSGCPPGTGDGDEEVNITGSASLATAQKWLPNDTAHITSPSGTTLSGTVTFTLYNDGTCGTSGGTSQFSPISKDVVNDADAGPTKTANDRYVSTGQTSFVVTSANDAKAWSWKVHYDDANLTDPTDACEMTTPAFTLTDG